ncbi:MAG: bifunctional oligoribonuclease/PAP phosphatase NrnA [Phycisphaeraceae bacterium]|nr:MAG: bifunctional oligoribonuclease/PAP phosphatase NrnA [Phycisphaeraceae bacterium]
MSTAASEGGGGWVSTVTIAEAAAWLSRCRRVVVTTHMKPDGDAAGSAVGLVRALAAKGIAARAWFAGPLPGWLAWFAGETGFGAWERDGAPADEPDGVVVVDTGSWTQLEAQAPWLRGRGGKTLVIDHHRRGDADVGERRVIETAKAAACQPVAALCAALLGVEASRLPVGVAQALYLGLATDTGWFRHSNVSPEVMRLAASLLEAGADAEALYRNIEQQNTAARFRLMARALASLELAGGGRVGVISLTAKDFKEAGASADESGGFIDLPQTIGSVEVSVLLTEGEPEAGAAGGGGIEGGGVGGGVVTKVSLRSKTDAVDVDLVARTMGGGGHKRAAGAKVRAGLAEARTRVLAALGVS